MTSSYTGRNPAYGLFEKQKLTPNGVDNIYDLLFGVGGSTSLLVVKNGQVLEPGTGGDYVIVSGGKQIQLTDIPLVTDVIFLIYLGKEISVARTVGNEPIFLNFTGDGAQDSFSVEPYGPALISRLVIFVDKIFQRPEEDFIVDGNNIVFTNPPANGIQIDVYITGVERADLVGIPSVISGNKIFTNNLVVEGDFQVKGTQFIIDSDIIHLKDNEIVLNSNFITGTPTLPSGIRARRGDEPDARLFYDETLDKWVFGVEGDLNAILSVDDLGATVVTTTGDQNISGVKTFNNNLGIGTVSPSKLLDVNGDILINELTIGRGGGNLNSNTTVGRFALGSNTTGNSNTAVGLNSMFGNTTGNQNTAVGRAALGTNTTGYQNTAVGRSALVYASTGHNNTAVGYAAVSSADPGGLPITDPEDITHSLNTGVGSFSLSKIISGVGNTGVGALSLFDNTTGGENVAIGAGALLSNTTASENVAVGFHALFDNTIGTANTAIGHHALLRNTTASVNTAVGHAALRENTTGSDNTAVGEGSLLSNTTGGQNTALGRHALLFNTTGNGNTAVGVAALYENSTGFANTALGREALRENTTGFGNTAVGSSALLANTTGLSNTAVGAVALLFNTTGNNNTALGRDALRENTTGNENTALGREALRKNTVGSDNTAIGVSSMLENTTGFENTAVGRAALANNTTGNQSTAVGYAALLANTTGLRNTALGREALRNNTVGNENTVVGHQAGNNITTGNTNTILGYNTGQSITTGSGNTIIGSQLAGSAALTNTLLVGSGGVERFRVNSSGNMGINTTSPVERLDVNGNIRANGNLIIGTQTNKATITYTTNTARTYTIPNVAASDFVMTAGTQSIAGAKTFSNAVQIGNYSETGATEGTQIFTNGNIATSRDTTGNIGHLFFVNPNGFVGSVSTSGNNTFYNTSSDYRLKNLIGPAQDSLQKIQSLASILKVYSFKSEPNAYFTGFFAHEVKEVVSEAITGEKDAVDEDGKIIPQGIDYSKLVPYIVGAVGEIDSILAKKIKDLQDLEEKIQNLENEIIKLKGN
jgi:NDP-sugar pyrophosphorylase family protein